MGSKPNLAKEDLNSVRAETTSDGLLTRNLTVVAKNPRDKYFYFGKIHCRLEFHNTVSSTCDKM